MTGTGHQESAGAPPTQFGISEAGRPLELAQVLDPLARITLDVLRADLVSIWLTDDGEPLLSLGAQAGLPLADSPVPFRPERDRGLARLILASTHPLPIEDIAHEPRLTDRAWFEAERVRSLLGIPLVADGAVFGFVVCMTRTCRVWSAGAVERGEALAAAVAVAIRNARRHGETEDRLRQAETLLAVGRAISSTLDFGEAMRRVARETCRALGAGTAAAYVLDDDGAGLLPMAGYHVPPQFLERFVQFPVRIRGNRAVEEGFRTRRPGWCSDAQMAGWTDPELIEWAPIRSVVFCPLFLKEEPIGGLFVLWWTTRGPLTAREVSLLEGIAWQTGLALSNARLFEARVRDAQELTARLQRTETLLAVAQAVGSTLDLGEVLRRTTREVVRALDADNGSAWCLTSGRDFLLPIAGYRVPKDITLDSESVPVVDHHAMVEQIRRMEDLVYSSDSRNDPRFDYPLLRTLPHRSVLVVPMRSRGEVLGCFVIVWVRGSHEFTDEELRLVEGIVRQAGIAIDNARLVEAERQREERQERLLALTRELAAETDLLRLYALTADRARQIMRADAAVLFLVDGDALVPATVVGGEADLADDRSIGNAVIGEGRPVVCADLAAEAAWCETPAVRRFGYRTALAVPLTVKEHALGVLVLLDRGRRSFPPGDVEFVVGLATQAGLAIENARLFETIARSLREARALLGVADSFGHDRELRDILRRVCREATRALGADSAMFLTVNEQTAVVTPVAGYRVPQALRVFTGPLVPADIPSVMREAREARRMLFVPDISADPRFETGMFAAAGIRSLLLSPVSSKHRLFGDLVLVWVDAVQQVSDGDLALMAAISAQAGLVLENSQLLEATQCQAAALQEKNAELDSFVHTVSHDLKAPLVTIQGMSTLVLDEHAAALDDEGRHYLTRVVANTRQMERLLLDLLALSSIGREARAPEEVSLRAVVDEILEELAEPLRTRGIDVVIGALPSVCAVRVRMEQIVRNLVTNAIKYMGEAPAPVIAIGSTHHDGEWEIWVRDTGIGIDPEYHEKVFEIFQRLKQIDAEGTGIGLPIVKKIVEGAGGRIWLESAPGRGSTFHFTWPTR